ncbi:MAG: hypothetical protein SNJ72_00555 [Fimbriimonadales bacterium]
MPSHFPCQSVPEPLRRDDVSTYSAPPTESRLTHSNLQEVGGY